MVSHHKNRKSTTSNASGSKSSLSKKKWTTCRRPLCAVCNRSHDTLFNKDKLPYTEEHTETLYLGPDFVVCFRELATAINFTKEELKSRTKKKKLKVNKPRLHEESDDGPIAQPQKDPDVIVPFFNFGLVPNWYQELSNTQMSVAEHLSCALKADVEEGYNMRTRKLLQTLGVLPLPDKSQIKAAADRCALCPVLFLLYLFKEVREESDEESSKYTVRERLILSALAHLVMPRTFVQLEEQMHAVPITACVESKRLPRKRKLKYQSPYQEPFPLGPPWAPKKPTVKTTTTTDFFLRQRKSSFFMGAPSTKPSSVESRKSDKNYKVSDSPGDVTSMSSGVTRVLAHNSRPSVVSMKDKPTSFKQLHPRYLTSTEPIVFIKEREVQALLPDDVMKSKGLEERVEPRPGSIYPITKSFIKQLTHSDLSKHPDLLLPPPIETLPALKLSAAGYWDALPKPPEYNGENVARRRKFTTKEPSSEMIEDVINILHFLAKKGNPLAALPDADLLPHIQKWLLIRSGHYLTEDKKQYYLTRSRNMQDHLYKTPLLNDTPKPPAYENLTWSSIKWFKKECKKFKDDFFHKVNMHRMKDMDAFWPTMCMKYFDNKHFRNVFFAYMPSKESEIFSAFPPEL